MPSSAPSATVLHAVPSWLEIDLARLAGNVRALRRRLQRQRSEPPEPPEAPPPPHQGSRQGSRFLKRGETSGAASGSGTAARRPRLCGVIKKNAYGLGAEALAPVLVEAGCDMLAVYGPDEAADLADHALETRTPILLLMPVQAIDPTGPLHRLTLAGGLHFTVHEADELHHLEAFGCALGVRLPVHLFVDTGMSRSGLGEAQLSRALAALSKLDFVVPTGICSHLACADEDPAFTDQQRDAFQRVVESAQPCLAGLGAGPGPRAGGVVCHLANTAATLRDPALHMDMVRCGLGLLGYGAQCVSVEPQAAAEGGIPELAPVLRWLSRVIHVQRYESGRCVGYGATHTLQRESVLGVVPVGYGDGYPLGLSNRAVVRLLHDDEAADHPVTVCPVLGRVNMDQIVIDLTDAPVAREGLAGRGVELISHDPTAPNALPRLAAQADLHCHAMLCQLAPHLPRRYVQ